MNLSQKTTLGRTGLLTSRLGLGPGIEARDVERAFERGINYFYWGSIRKPAFGKGVAAVARRHREDIVIVVQTYTRAGWMMKGSVERALRNLGTEYTDILLLGWWQAPPPERIVDAALALKEAGKVKHIMVSCHHRPTFEVLAKNSAFGSLMVRYNAAHPGAEREVFPLLGQPKPGVVAYTATRWGALLDPKFTPDGDPTPTSADCYRFSLTNPSVDVCLAAPSNGAQLNLALTALTRGPMREDELAWMKRVGQRVRSASVTASGNTPVAFLDRLMRTEKSGPASPPT